VAKLAHQGGVKNMFVPPMANHFLLFSPKVIAWLMFQSFHILNMPVLLASLSPISRQAGPLSMPLKQHLGSAG